MNKKKLINSSVIHETLTYRANDIISDISITTPLDSDGTNSLKCMGVWDTGSHGCVISSELIKSLKPPLIGYKLISGIVSDKWSAEYLLNIHFSNEFVIQGISACEGPNLHKDEFLIGMDIINMGDFAITNVNQKTAYSYRTPSVRRINFQAEKNNAAKEIDDTKKRQNKATRRTRKNRKRKKRK